MEALSAALACMTGQTEVMSPRSLLSNSEGFVTVMFKSERPIEYVSYCWNALRRVLPNDAVESVRGMQVRNSSVRVVGVLRWCCWWWRNMDTVYYDF